MVNEHQIEQKLIEANPVSRPEHLHEDPSEAQALLALIMERRDAMTTTQNQKPVHTQTEHRWRPATVAAATAILVLIVVGVAAFIGLNGGGEEAIDQPAIGPETQTTLPSAGTTLSPVETTLPESPPTPPSGEIDLTNLAWDRTPMTGINDAPVALAQWNGEFVALGNGCIQAYISANLTSWESVATLNDSGPVPWCALAAMPGGPLVAITNPDGIPPQAWVSDDGRTWDKASGRFVDADEVVEVVAAGPGFVAVGSNALDARVWTSADGRLWTRVLPDTATTIQLASFNAIATDGDVIVAGGVNKSQPTLQPGMWTSQDGTTWTGAALPESCRTGSVYHVAHGPDGFVASGICMGETDEMLRSRVLHSTDGLTWTQVEDAALTDLAVGRDIAAGPVGYAFAGVTRAVGAGGSEVDTVAVWVSSDGLMWARYELDGADRGLAVVGPSWLAVTGIAESGPVVLRGTEVR